MKVTNDELQQLIDVVFNRVYQFIAWRESEKYGPELNYTNISGGNYKTIWKLAGYDDVPDRPQDEQETEGEWQVYVDDQFIDAAASALQIAWKTSQSRKIPKLRLFRSNSEIIEFYKMNGDRELAWTEANSDLNADESKWQKAFRKKKAVRHSNLPKYRIFVSRGEPYKCKVLKKAMQEVIRFDIPQKATTSRAIWCMIVDHVASTERTSLGCTFTIQEVQLALGRVLDGTGDIDVQVWRFNKIWKTETGDDATLLKRKKGVFWLQAALTVEDDPEDALERMRSRNRKHT